MGVVFKGGTSGNRQDGIAPMPSSGTPQPVLDTATNSVNPAVHLQAENFRPHRHGQESVADFMPSCGTIPEGSSDVAEQGLPKGGMS